MDLVSKFKERMGKNFMTPHVLDYKVFGNNIIELSEGTGIENEPIYGLTHQLYDEKKDEFIDLGFSRMFRDKNKLIRSANLLKETELCTSIETKEQEKFCNEFMNEVDIPPEFEEAVPKEYPGGNEIPDDIRKNLYLKYISEALV